MKPRIIERVQMEATGSRPITGLPPGFRFDVLPTRLFVVGPMNPEWSETVKLPEGMRIEVFTPSGGGTDQPPLAVLAAGAPSAITFRKRVPRGTPSVQYLVAVRDGSNGTTPYLAPNSVVEIEPGRGRFANITFGDDRHRIHVHFDIVQ